MLARVGVSNACGIETKKPEREKEPYLARNGSRFKERWTRGHRSHNDRSTSTGRLHRSTGVRVRAQDEPGPEWAEYILSFHSSRTPFPPSSFFFLHLHSSSALKKPTFLLLLLHPNHPQIFVHHHLSPLVPPTHALRAYSKKKESPLLFDHHLPTMPPRTAMGLNPREQQWLHNNPRRIQAYEESANCSILQGRPVNFADLVAYRVDHFLEAAGLRAILSHDTFEFVCYPCCVRLFEANLV